MKADAIVEQMLDSPELPFVVHRLQAVLNSERPLRERFYDEITEDGKVEFINGKVVVQSPARLKHIQVAQRLVKLLETFVELGGAGVVTSEKALVCLTRNDYEPDLCFFGEAKARQFTSSQLKFPAPDWVCEILSESTEAIDRTVKYQDYALHGVQEYWLVDADREAVEIHLLENSSYRLAAVVTEGKLESRVIAGFCVPVRALFDSGESASALRAILG